MIGGDASAAASDDSAQPVVAEELRQPAEPGQELARELAAINPLSFATCVSFLRSFTMVMTLGWHARPANSARLLKAGNGNTEDSRLGRGYRRLRTCSRLCIE